MKKIISTSLVILSSALILAACQDKPKQSTDSISSSHNESIENSSSDGGETSMQNSSDKTDNSTMDETSSETTIEATTTAVKLEETKKPSPYEITLPEARKWTEDFQDENFSIKGIESVRQVGLITGDGSENKTRERFRVGGTDLGIPVVHNEQLYLWFGDTFWGSMQGKPMEGGLWRSNVLAISSDTRFDDGLAINDMIGNEAPTYKYATELILSKKIPGEEHTVIPTGAVSIDGKLYTYFMSVNSWGAPGQWKINYGGLAVSEDDGESFKKLDQIKLDPDRFGQFAAKVVGEYVYGVGIGGGRFGDAYLSRVKVSEIEKMEAYEYFTGMDGETPIFSNDSTKAIKIIDKMVGEPSFMFNEYLGEWVVTYLDEAEHAIVMRTAKELWGPYSDELIMAHSSDFPALYGGFVDEYLTVDGGKTFYFIMSMWDPVYNSILMEVNLK